MKENIKLNQELYSLIEDEQFDRAYTFIKKNQNSLKETPKSYKTFMTKIFLGKNRIKSSYLENKIITMKNLRKTNYLEILKNLYNTNRRECFKLFEHIVKKFELLNIDIDFLINNEMFEIFKLLDGYYLKTFNIKSNTSKKLLTDKKLKKYKVDSNNKDVILDLIYDKLNKKSRKRFLNNINNIDYDVVIDVGNVLHKGFKNFYKFIMKIKKKYKKSLLVIHEKHLKKSISNSNNVNMIIDKIINSFSGYIVKTPYNFDDDLYILYASLKKQVPIITSDKYRNHFVTFNLNIKNKNLLMNFINENYILVYFDQDKGIWELNDTISNKNYSNCIQLIDNVVTEDIYIPTFDNGFYRITLNNN
jgi:hypothetical protein